MSLPDQYSSEPEMPVEAKEAYQELDFSGIEHSLLTCPKCNHFISGKDINIEKTVAKCDQCQHVFGYEHDSSTKRLKPTILIPDGVETLKLKTELDIRLKWSDTTPKGGRWFILFFATVWNLFVLPFAIAAVVSGAWGILLFLSAHLAVGLGLLWHLATIFFNQTSISVTKNRIRIRTLPLRSFLWKSKEIDTDKMRQLYVTRYVQSTSNGRPNHAFALYAIMDDGKKVSLIRGMNRETQVYVEQEIEGYLGIKNKKVPEESK